MFTLYVVTLYITYNYRQYYILGFPGGSDGKESVWNAGYLGRSLGQEDPLEKWMAAHYGITYIIFLSCCEALSTEPLLVSFSKLSILANIFYITTNMFLLSL